MTQQEAHYEPYGPIHKLAEDIYVVDGEWYETAFRRRMTIIRLKDKSLVIHSAVRIKDEDLGKLDQLGKVATIVVPNIFHDSDAHHYATRYPNARVYVPAKLRKKCEKSMKIAGDLETGWPHQSELPCIPFLKSFCSESVFVHIASGSLIVTDLAFNMKPHDFKSGFERKVFGEWNGIIGRLSPSKITKYLMAANRDAVREALNKISSFDFNRVIISHGEIVETGGKNAFLDGYKRVYGEL